MNKQLVLFEPLAAMPGRAVRDPAALRPQPARNGADFWATPPCLTDALVRHVLPEVPGAIWECAAGDGCLADAMRAAVREVLATDLLPRGPGIGRLDFLHDDPPGTGFAVVTNPPFGQLDRFLTRGLQLLDGGVAGALVLLVRNDALTADSRAEALNRASAEWACSWRPVWLPATAGGGRWSNSWVLWHAGRHGPPVVRRLRRNHHHSEHFTNNSGEG